MSATHPSVQAFRNLLDSFVVSIDEFCKARDSHPALVDATVHNLKSHLVFLSQRRPDIWTETVPPSASQDPCAPRADKKTKWQDTQERQVAASLLGTPSTQLPERASSEPPENCADHDNEMTVANPAYGRTSAPFQKLRLGDFLEAPAPTFPAPSPSPLNTSRIPSPTQTPSAPDPPDASDIALNCINGSVAWLQGSDNEAQLDNTAALQRTEDDRRQEAISCLDDDGILKFRPTKDQWPSCFHQMLREARSRGADKVGAFKICLAHSEPPRRVSFADFEAHSYRTQVRQDGTVGLELQKDVFVETNAPFEKLSTMQAVTSFEKKLRREESYNEWRYCLDMPAHTTVERQKLGISKSPIWPLESNKLDQTKFRVPGIHWPYVYKSNDTGVGSAFAIHIDDWETHALNYLYEGAKIWFLIPASAKEKLEPKLQTDKLPPRCAQFVKEKATYVPTVVLNKWNIRYKIMQQNPKELVVVLPNTYHQGFSVGTSFAEAVNYADKDWNPTGYKACIRGICPEGFIGRDQMALRQSRDEQISEEDERIPKPDANQNSNQPQAQRTQAQLNKPMSLRASHKKGKRVIKPPKPAKRKAASASEESAAKRPAVVDHLSLTFQAIRSNPQISALEIFNRFRSFSTVVKCHLNDERCFILTRLFNAIGSPDAVSQLRTAYKGIKSAQSKRSLTAGNFAEANQALIYLENKWTLDSIEQRFHLVSLYRYRDAVLDEVRITRHQNPEQLGKNATLANKRLMAAAYPDVEQEAPDGRGQNEEYTLKLGALSKRIQRGQCWLRLENAFTPGILALVPTQGDYGLSNTEYADNHHVPTLLIVTALKRFHYRQLTHSYLY